MAALFFTTSPVAVALAAATLKCIQAVKFPTNQRGRLWEWWIDFDGVTSSAVPGLVELTQYTTDGTGTALTAGTDLVRDPTDMPTTLQSTGKFNYTVDPTTPTVREKHTVGPYGGRLYMSYQRQGGLVIPGGQLIAIRCTFAAVVNAIAGMRLEE